MNDHINGYSLALFSIAKEEKKLPGYKKQALLIIDAINSVDDYKEIMNKKSLKPEIKKDLIKKAFEKAINKNLLNFIFLLIDKNKFRVLIPALKKMIKFINMEQNINEGIVFTPTPLLAKEIKGMETRTKEILGIKVSLQNKIDTKMISGFRIQVGDELIEDSVSSRLEGIRKQLLRGGNNVSER